MGRGVLALAAIALAALPVAAEPTRVTWSDAVQVATGGGHKGPWRMNRSRYDYVDDPTVAVNDAGVVAVAYGTFRRDHGSALAGC